VVAGRVRSMRETAGGVEVAIARRASGKVESRTFDTIVNCTGPLGAMARTANPILKQMLADRLIAVDDLGIGVDVDANDRAGDKVWALGPMTKGRYWEIIAVPDIRGQAAAVAADIEAELAK
jgi:uncharacterized NAD(P)/FAD-binding protein YdhS